MRGRTHGFPFTSPYLVTEMEVHRIVLTFRWSCGWHNNVGDCRRNETPRKLKQSTRLSICFFVLEYFVLVQDFLRSTLTKVSLMRFNSFWIWSSPSWSLTIEPSTDPLTRNTFSSKEDRTGFVRQWCLWSSKTSNPRSTKLQRSLSLPLKRCFVSLLLVNFTRWGTF